jgi:transposase
MGGPPLVSALTYKQMIRDSGKDKFGVRLAMVKYARTHGIRAAARHFSCSRNTIRHWKRCYDERGLKGLRDASRAPHSCPHKTSAYHERRVLEARRRVPCFGPRRLKDSFDLKPSLGAIARILRQRGLTKKPRRKARKKNDLRRVKQQYRAFERLQADTKPLYDIAAYWPQMRAHGLPRQQYTHRDVKSGALFIDYADELSTSYACMASRRILEHLGRHGVALSGMVLSTDNGSEYGGTERREREIGYHADMQRLGPRHRFLPPATPNAHGDVESSHSRIEQEFFDLEYFRSRRDFFEKITTYQHWWNFARPNYSKGGRTPAEILAEEGVDLRLLLRLPEDLDALLRKGEKIRGVGQNLPVDTVRWPGPSPLFPGHVSTRSTRSS